MRRRKRAQIAVAAIVAALAVATVLTARHPGSTRADAGHASNALQDRAAFTIGACPRALRPGAHAPEGVLRALRRAVPETWRVVNQEGEVRLTPAHYDIEQISTLGADDFDFKGRSSKFGRIATKVCGRDVGLRSWVAIVHFPEATVDIASQGIGFFARTSRGWRLWYRYR